MLIYSARLGWPIWCADGFDRLLLSLEFFIGRAFYWLQLLLHLQCLVGLNVSFLLEGLDHFGQLTFFLLSLREASSTCLSSASRASLFADRSEIFCLSVSPEDYRMPMLLCFSTARRFTCITSSESWAWVALSARRWEAF